MAEGIAPPPWLWTGASGVGETAPGSEVRVGLLRQGMARAWSRGEPARGQTPQGRLRLLSKAVLDPEDQFGSQAKRCSELQQKFSLMGSCSQLKWHFGLKSSNPSFCWRGKNSLDSSQRRSLLNHNAGAQVPDASARWR